MDEGSVGHLETVLERTEGKVASGETQAGTLIQFCFTLAPGQPSQLPEARTSRLVNPLPARVIEPKASATQRSDEYAEPDGAD